MEFTKNNERWLQHTINSLVVEHGYPIDIAIRKILEVISDKIKRTKGISLTKY